MYNMKGLYDPMEFLHEAEILTVAVIGTFATWKLLTIFYDTVYDPSIDLFLTSTDVDKYYVRIGKKYVKLDPLFREGIKWVLVIIVLMFVYNLVKKHAI